MIVNLFSDVHLGISRKAHTTQSSSDLWNEAIYLWGMAAREKYTASICAGDLFDKTFNHEKYILQGYNIAKDTIVLSGNHDETNRDDTVSSLKALSQMDGTNIIRLPVGAKGYNDDYFDGRIVFIPHVATQELFVESLEDALAHATNGEYLVVHCNRGVIMEHAQADSTLFIDEEMERKLTTKFKRIFYGHEHKPYHGSNVTVLGNVFPTSFSDISDKFTCQLNLNTGEVKYTKIFDAARHYLKVDLIDIDKVNEDTFFLELTGEYPSRQVNETILELREKFENLLAVRSLCTYTDRVNTEVVEIDLQQIDEVISKELEGSELSEIYEEIRRDI